MSDPVPVDARNLLCPLPVIRTQEAMAHAVEGARIRVTATDPGVLHDIPAWCRVHGHAVEEVRQEGREIHLLLRAGPQD